MKRTKKCGMSISKVSFTLGIIIRAQAWPDNNCSTLSPDIFPQTALLHFRQVLIVLFFSQCTRMEQVTLRSKISRGGSSRSKNIFATKLARQLVDEFPTRNVCVGHFFVKNPGVYSGEVQQIVKNGKGP